MDPVINKIRQHIIDNDLIQKGDKLLLSVSAGKDSVTLVTALLALKQEFSCELALFHLNHLTRGAESDRDAVFIEKCAAQHELTLRSESYDFQKNRIQGMSFEQQAREVRYKLLAQLSEKYGYTKIVTAHNYDDSIETILMRIFTGTGIRGLRGIDSKRGSIIRPLLCLPADEIYQYLQRNNISWREDSTNKENKYRRNFVRNELIPRIKEQFPMYARSIQNLAEISHDYYNYFENILEKEYDANSETNGDKTYIPVESTDSGFLLTNLLIKILREQYNCIINRSISQEIVKNYTDRAAHVLLYRNDTVEIRKTWYKNAAYIMIDWRREPLCTGEWIYQLDITKEQSSIYIPEITASIGYKVFDSNYFKKNYTTCDKKMVFVSINSEIKTVFIRNRRAGDKIRLESGTKKLKKYFIEKKLDNEIKNCVPLLIIDTAIAAILSAFSYSGENRVSGDFLITDNTKKILALYRE